MAERDVRDVFGGCLLAAFGAATLGYTISNYELGSVARMGTGMFPAALAFILLVFGTIQAVQGYLRHGVRPEIPVRQPFFVLLSIAFFALTIRSVGVFPAIFGVTILSSFADRAASLRNAVLLAAALCLIAWLIFGLGLGLNLPMLRWPF